MSGASLFTGIVQACAQVVAFTPLPSGAHLSLEAPPLWSLQAGESVAVNGCCLTATASGSLAFDLSPETLLRISVASLRPGSRVNLERAARVGDLLGGHTVAGHIDGLARVVGIQPEGAGARWRLRLAPHLARFVAEKGSLALDGVSLTPFEVRGDTFSVALIPHTLHSTNLSGRVEGDDLNFEADVIARYVLRAMEALEAGKA